MPAHDLAVGHDDDPLGDLERDVHVVLDQEERHIITQRAQHRGQALPLAARKSRRRLVEHHHHRVGDNGHAHLELALLSMGQVAHQGIELVGQPDGLGGPAAPFTPLLIGG